MLLLTVEEEQKGAQELANRGTTERVGQKAAPALLFVLPGQAQFPLALEILRVRLFSREKRKSSMYILDQSRFNLNPAWRETRRLLV